VHGPRGRLETRSELRLLDNRCLRVATRATVKQTALSRGSCGENAASLWCRFWEAMRPSPGAVAAPTWQMRRWFHLGVVKAPPLARAKPDVHVSIERCHWASPPPNH
jgi:hypothetical protein